jgi:hypothetical protein
MYQPTYLPVSIKTSSLVSVDCRKRRWFDNLHDTIGCLYEYELDLGILAPTLSGILDALVAIR